MKHYKNYCRILTNVIREAKKQTYNDQITKSTHKIKTTWNIIKKEINKNERLNDTTNYENTPEAFNNYFLTISENITKNISSNGPPRPFANISFKNTSAKEIENIIKSLKSRESHGYNEITTRMLKISDPFISFPLTYIFNKVMITEIFPSRLKYALIKPIFKNGDKKKIANYKPISLLPSFSRIIEKIIYNRLMNHMTTNNILTLEQYCFRPSSSMEQLHLTLSITY